MTQAVPTTVLPALMASIRQQALDGELVLEQLEGTRRLAWSQGDLVQLRSDVNDEQLGPYLLRQGILNLKDHSELLTNNEFHGLDEKVIQWGMMSVQERDCHQLSLQEQILIHALEQPVLQVSWKPGASAAGRGQELPCKVEHRGFIWNTFQEAKTLFGIQDLLQEEAGWQWEGRANLLDTVADLPLNPATAYALSFLGSEPISFDTFVSLSQMAEADAGRLLLSLWVLGALTLTKGPLPTVGPTTRSSLPIAGLVPREPQPRLAATPAPVPAFSPDLVRAPEPMPEPPAGLADLPAAKAPALAPSPEGALRAKKLLMEAKKLLLQERTGEAVRALEQAAQLGSEADCGFETYLLLGRLRMANPAWSSRAIDAFQAASRIQPQAAEPWASMGALYHRKGFASNALACFQRALELDPSVPIPADINLHELAAAPPVGAPAPSLVTRLKSFWK